ncbi:MAG: PEP-CTERM sorting domain-containing protein [Pirellulaceae bacterium]
MKSLKFVLALTFGGALVVAVPAHGGVWNTFDGGFASSDEFWNPDFDKGEAGAGNSFNTYPVATPVAFTGTEFTMPQMPSMLQTQDVDASTGGPALGGGQLSTQAAAWTSEKPAPMGTFDFARLIVPKGATFTTIGYSSDEGPISLDVPGRIGFYGESIDPDYNWIEGNSEDGLVGRGIVKDVQLNSRVADGDGEPGADYVVHTVEVTMVPEPTSMALAMLGAGLVGLLAFCRRRSRA